MSVFLGIIGSFVATIAFSVLLETPRKYLWQTGIVGAVGGGVYLGCTHHGVDVVTASFFLLWQLHLWHICLREFLKLR